MKLPRQKLGFSITGVVALVILVAALASGCGATGGQATGSASVSPISPVPPPTYPIQVWMDGSAQGGGPGGASSSFSVSKPSIGGGARQSTASSASFTVQGGVYGAF
jgi:hypothetical protein